METCADSNRQIRKQTIVGWKFSKTDDFTSIRVHIQHYRYFVHFLARSSAPFIRHISWANFESSPFTYLLHQGLAPHRTDEARRQWRHRCVYACRYLYVCTERFIMFAPLWDFNFRSALSFIWFGCIHNRAALNGIREMRKHSLRRGVARRCMGCGVLSFWCVPKRARAKSFRSSSYRGGAGFSLTISFRVIILLLSNANKVSFEQYRNCVSSISDSIRYASLQTNKMQRS